MGQLQTGWLVGPLAQMVERRHHTPRVTGSIPVRSTMRSSSGRVPGDRKLRVRVPPQSVNDSCVRGASGVYVTRSDRVNRAGLIAREVACDVRVSGPLAQMEERLVYTQ